MKKSKRALSLVLCGAMLLGYFPAVSFAAEADGLCEHHTVHENCGYVAAVAGTDCGHEHNDNCFTATCAHVHGDCGYVAAVEGVDCNHQHDGACGYAKAVAEVPCTCQQKVHTGDCAYAPAVPEGKCTHVHGDCGYVAAVEGVDCNHQHDGACGYAEAVAEVPCTRQQEVHTGDCAYAPAVPEGKCTHVHGECSYVEAKNEIPCGHDCTAEEACGEKVLNCSHTHDGNCGYVAAVEGKDCEFLCETCSEEEATAAAVAEVKALMDALPELDTVEAMSTEDQKAAYEQTQAAYEAYSKLTADQQLELPDPEEVFKPLFDYFNTLIDADGEIGSGTPDGTPPIPTSLTLSVTEVTAPSTLDIIIDATDDVSGVASSQITFYCKETDKTLHTHLNYENGKLQGTLIIDQYVQSGTFMLNALLLYDKAGNHASYSAADLKGISDSLEFSVVANQAPDTTPPVPTGLTLSATELAAPGTVDIMVEVTDDVSGVASSQVTFYCKETDKTIHTHLKYEDGKLQGTLKIDQYVASGTFTLNSLLLYDKAGNHASYSASDLQNISESLVFSVVASQTPDTTPPVPSGLILSTVKVTAPGILGIIVEVTDDVSGVASSQVTFSCKATAKTLHTHLSYEDGKLQGTLKIDQYVESGTFVLNSLLLYDKAGNHASFDAKASELSSSTLSFRVFNAIPDITTSVSTSGFVDTVKNSDSNAYIAADYSGEATMPKEAFDAIKGTDKTIDLISEGITWRFEGSDITEEIKDIDLKVDIQKVEDDSSASGEAIEDNLNGNPGVVMKFPENGTLPGKATIQVKVDYAMREYLGSSTGLSVYYYNNQTGKLELIASNLKVINDTYVEFPITHCSYYVLTNPNGSNSGSTFPGIAVDKTNFPDENFRTWILEQDYGKDGQLTAEELVNVIQIDVSQKKIADLTGIEHFTALQYLFCVDNQLTKLDVSQNTGLIVLQCGDNQLTKLDISKNTALNYLDCGGNLLTSLDISKNTALNYLYCGGNLLTRLDVSNNTGLEYLVCYSNQITALDLQNNIALKNLNCNYNSLTALEVSHLVDLTGLGCDNNQLKELDVSKNTKLENLGCSMNQLTKLDVSQNTGLTVLQCGDNQLTKLDISKNTALNYLNCGGNLLTSLDVSKHTKLDYLGCSMNQLTKLDVSKNTVLRVLYCGGNQLSVLDVSNQPVLEHLTCINNQLTSLDLSSNPKCSEVNAAGNRRQIKLNSDNTFVLSTLPGFDVNKASQWTGATVDNQTLTAKGKNITYSYQVDSGKSVKFTLQANNYDPNAGKMEETWGNLTWKIDEAGTLTISGTGEMVHFMDGWEALSVPPIDGYPWHRYADLIQSVVVEEGVTTLAEIAFHGLDNLQSVTLPDSLTSIGGAAFAFCTSLESITIPANVSTIGKEIFIGSTAFKQITFTGKAPSFDSAAFGEITAEAYYPCDNDTWTTEVQHDYGGDITWVGHVFGQWTTEGNTSSRTCTRCGYTEHKVSTDSGNVEIEIPDQPELDVEVNPVLPTEENYILVEEALESIKYDVLKVFDINLKNANGAHVQPNGTVKIKLPLDWEKDGNYKVYRVNTDKTLTDMNAYRQGSHMVFETDHFSIYVIAEKIDITAPTAKTLTYTGSAQALVNAGSTTSGTMQYSLDGVTYSASVPTATNAGTYTVYYKGEGSQEAAQTVSVTIAKAKVTITADNKVAAVGTAKPTLTYTVAGLKGSDKLSTNPTLTCNATMSTAGDYEIVVSGGDAGANYEIQRVNGKLSVKKEHKVNVAAVTNGTVSVSHEKAIEGTEIVITATPKSGYHFSTLTVKDAAGTSYVVSTDNNGKYYFIMPDVDVTVTVSFSKNVTADPTNPKTGDEFAVVLWSGIMMTSLLCMAVIIPSRKKFR